MTSHLKCAVINCQSSLKTTSYYRFPHPRKNFDGFLNWVKATGNPKLRSPLEIDVYNKYRICEKHFCPEDFIMHKKIRKDIVPTQFLPDPLHFDLGIDTPVTDTKINLTPPLSFDVGEESMLGSFTQAVGTSPRKRKYYDDAEPETSDWCYTIKIKRERSCSPEQ